MEKIKKSKKEAVNKNSDSKKNKGKQTLNEVLCLIMCSSLTIILVFVLSLFAFGSQNKSAIHKTNPIKLDKSVANWKTYNDNKYGFEIKYPANISSPSIGKKEDVGIKEVQKEINFIVDNNSKVSILVWNKEAIDENGSVDKKYNKLDINNNPAWQSNRSQENNGVYYLESYVYTQSHVYQIKYAGANNNENIRLYKEMVFTLQTNEK